MLPRFFLFWLADYVTATVGVLVLSFAARAVFHLPIVSTLGALLVIPLSTFLFSYLAYRSLYTHHVMTLPQGTESRKQNMLIAGSWALAALVVDTVIALVAYDYPLVPFITSPIVISNLGLKFAAVLVGGYLAKARQFSSQPATNFLDEANG